MVSTYLNRGFMTNHNLDSIKNQKIKLIYIIDVLFELIDNALNKENIDELENCKVVLAIEDGLDGKADKVPGGYEEYYKIYSSEYNHKFIRYNKKTISHLLALLN